MGFSKPENQRQRRRERMELVNRYKEQQGCYFCGETDPLVLDLHHIDPTIKVDAVSILVNNRAHFDKIEAEMQKCVVLCSNDHRRVHAGTLTISDSTKGRSQRSERWNRGSNP